MNENIVLGGKAQKVKENGKAKKILISDRVNISIKQGLLFVIIDKSK